MVAIINTTNYVPVSNAASVVAQAEPSNSGVISLPVSIGAGLYWYSDLVTLPNLFSVTAIGTLSQAGTLAIFRFADRFGSVLSTAPATQAMTANTPASLTVSDGAQFMGFAVRVFNNSASAATLTAFTIQVVGG